MSNEQLLERIKHLEERVRQLEGRAFSPGAFAPVLLPQMPQMLPQRTAEPPPNWFPPTVVS